MTISGSHLYKEVVMLVGWSVQLSEFVANTIKFL